MGRPAGWHGPCLIYPGHARHRAGTRSSEEGAHEHDSSDRYRRPLPLGGFFGTLFGLLVAGAVSLRPDRGWLLARAVDDAREGYNLDLVHAGARAEAERAQRLLESGGGEPYSVPDLRSTLHTRTGAGAGTTDSRQHGHEEETSMSKDKVKPTGGEGDRQSDRRYREQTREFVEEHGEDATHADRPRDRGEAARIEKAEERARERAREKDPSVVRDDSRKSR